ncbi:MAG TPA: RraA family protein [Bryobacteraceae bacterium]
MRKPLCLAIRRNELCHNLSAMGDYTAEHKVLVDSSELELIRHIETNLYTAVVCDALDELGYRNQAMRERLRPLSSNDRFAGRARTISCVDVAHIPADPYAMEIEAVDSILEGEVAVVSTSYSGHNAPWGELLSTAARARGAKGAVVDGLVRDVRKIEELGFPVFAAGIKPVDSRGRGLVIAYNVTIECGEVQVSPGDLIFADYDGVVAIPAAVVDQTIELATDKVVRENHSRAELLRGAFLRDVYKKYGVL